MKNDDEKMIHVGNIGVDAGLCWIGDPCYIIGQENNIPFKFWSDFFDEIYPKNQLPNDSEISKNGSKSFNYKTGHEGLGIVVSTGHGDGFYPVYVTKNKEGLIKSVTVIFIDDDE